MRTADLQYALPPELIAQQPVEPRDSSRLLVLQRAAGTIEHRVFRDIAEYLHAGDSLTVNDTRVLPARFFCRRASGGKIEALFLRAASQDWYVLLKPSARLQTGEVLHVRGAESQLRLLEKRQRGVWRVAPVPLCEPLELLDRVGQAPLPPYIRRDVPPGAATAASDRERYQTIYARNAGAVAAPTAGLHFTPELLGRIAGRGVERTSVTLHVGLGTFAPIEADELSQHRMHAEWYEVQPSTLRMLGQTRAQGGRIVAVGTTSARVLESLPDLASSATTPRTDWTDIFIYPPYAFRHVDVLLTNFHLPGSTLIALVMAFASPDLIRRAYAEAIAERYRFYSYGDAMLII